MLMDQAVAELRAAIRGNVIVPAQAAVNALERPALITCCTNVEDIQASLAFARQHALKVEVTARTPSPYDEALAAGALLIDLRAMNRVTVDVAARRATVQGGALWSEVDAVTQAFGLAMTGDPFPHASVASAALSGGVGHLVRRFGLVCDHLLGAQLVTSDGRLLDVDATRHPDMFWALRGGVGNFGIVSDLVFRLQPLETEVFAGMIFWAPDKGPELMRRYRALCESCPDEISTLLSYVHAPSIPEVPREVRGQPGYALIVVGTDVAPTERSIALRRFGSPLFDSVTRMPYLTAQNLLATIQPVNANCYASGHYLDDLSDEVIQAVHRHTAYMPAGPSQLRIVQLGGAMARVPESESAFPVRSAAFQALFVGAWTDDADRPTCTRWARHFHDALRGHTRGSSFELRNSRDEAMLRMTYGAEKLARLQQIEAKYSRAQVTCPSH